MSEAPVLGAVSGNGLLMATLVTTFLGTIVTLVTAWFKEARDRRWKLEDEARQKDLEGQVKEVHKIINSQATAGQHERLLALQGQLVLMQRMIILNKEQGIETTKADSDLLVAMQSKVDDLNAALNLRQPEPTEKPEQTGEAVKVGDLEVSIDQLSGAKDEESKKIKGP